MGRIIGYAHIQLWNDNRAACRIMVIEEQYWNKSFGGYLLCKCEEWLKENSYKRMHIQSIPEAYNFYLRNGYSEKDFDDPDQYESAPSDIEMGKIYRVDYAAKNV